MTDAWTDGLQLLELRDIPMPLGFDRARVHVGPQRCQLWRRHSEQVYQELLKSGAVEPTEDHDSPPVIDIFMHRFGADGRPAGCPWHQMDDPAAVLATCTSLFHALSGLPRARLIKALSELSASLALTARDVDAVGEFLLHPIRISQGGGDRFLSDGAHRLCALRASVLHGSSVVVAID